MFRSDKRDRVVASISTLIADGTTIHGDIQFDGGLHLDGAVNGTIAAEGPGAVLTLSEKGRVKGEVHVFSAVINGMVEGDLHVAERLELGASARINGNVYYKVLEMTAGAQVTGSMNYVDGTPRRLTGPVADADAAAGATATASA
ncbi:MAG: polymer-forming cytoskeletal protein [Dokdonella sp.]|nr:MAG: polymer-forming cytoskeletal protein [Dokdonella sp.]